MYSVIYLIRNLINGKCYIGKTNGKMKDRVTRHLNGKTPGCRGIHNAIKKHGKENFSVEVLESNVFPEMLFELERFYIAKFDTFHNGYNLTEGGEGALGYTMSVETRRKLSEINKGKPAHNRSDAWNHQKQIIKLYTVDLLSSKEIGKRFNVASDTILNILRSNNIKIRVGQSQFKESPHSAAAKKLFFSLSEDMPLPEKRKFLRKKFPNVSRKTIYDWVRYWHSKTVS